MQGMPGKRLEMILQMLEQNPTDNFLLYGLANEYKNEGDLDKAVASYRHLMEVNPDYVAAYYHCGQALESAGDPTAAAAIYDAGIAIARRIGDAHALSELQAARDILG
jgi:tetratricopeptide (TPR) repeat protein